MPTSAAIPATITPHARTETRDATSPTQHNGTSASWRVSPNTVHTYKPCNAHRTLARRIQTHKPRTPARRPHSTKHCALRKHHRMHTAARTPHTARHTAPTTAHTAHRKSHPVHTRGLHATLTSELSNCPASTGCCRTVGCYSSTTPCRTHEQPSRHPTPPPTPASRPQRMQAHRINQLKSNESQSAHCMLSLTHNTVCE
jgi:hypothetical protein